MTGYCVENAKSNRSTCKGCSSKIARDDVRVGTVTAGPNGYDMTSWRHLGCQRKPKAHSLSAPSELRGYASLNADDAALVRLWFAGDVAAVKSAQRVADAAREASGDATPKKARTTTSSSASASAAPPLRLYPASAPSPPTTNTTAPFDRLADEEGRRVEATDLFTAMPIAVLKHCLRANGQLLSGNKLDLVERCVDRKLYGNLPRCSKCGIGRLKVTYLTGFGHKGQGVFTCPGGYDDDEYVRCSYRSSSEVRPAWIETEEQSFTLHVKSQKRKAPIEVD